MRKLRHQTVRALTGWAFISPWVIGFLLFTLYPLFRSLYLSFHDANSSGLINGFVGFDNFIAAFTTKKQILEAITQFLKDAILKVFIINVFAVLFAVLLNTNVKGRGFFRTLFFLPVVIVSGPVMAKLSNSITMPNLGELGVIRIIGETFGASVQELITTSFSDLIYMFWFSGVQLIVYLSMIQKMDKSMYEAAQMDGASPWESFWKITLPALKPAILINVIYTFLQLSAFADNPVITVIEDMRKSTLSNEGYGMAAAYAWIYFAVLAVIVVIIFLVFYLRKEKKYGISFNRDRLGLPLGRYEKKVTKFNSMRIVKKTKRFFLGRNVSDGFVAKFFIYLLLIVVSFAFLYPLIDMFFLSLQSAEDILNPMIGTLPSGIYFDNYVKAFNSLGFFKALWQSVYHSLIPTICQVVAASFVGYGLARFQFKGKIAVMLLIVATFILPTQITMIPTYALYADMGLLGSPLTFALPALLGQGLKSTVFILIFYQSFAMIPKELDEAAYIDGANSFKVFLKIAIPLSIPIIIVGFIFSFVWYWNETYLTALYTPGVKTLPIQLNILQSEIEKLYPQNPMAPSITNSVYDAILMAGTLVSILPLLLMYFVLQRWFVEGIDRAGLTGQ